MRRKRIYEPDVHKYILTQPRQEIKPYTFNPNRALRYCESCKSHQPKTSNKMVKGWKCDKCRGKEKEKEVN
jgi:hypothetical protein